MENIYRFVGLIAPINQWFARFRANFIIPANWLLIFALGVFVALNVYRLVSHLGGSQTPQPVSALLSSSDRPSGFVTVTGLLRTGPPVQPRRDAAGVRRPGTVDARNLLVPLVDRGSGQGILVRIAPQRTDAGGEDVSVEGSIRPIQPDLARQLAARNYIQNGVPVDRRFMLVEGPRPGSIPASTLGLLITLPLFVAFAWGSLTRNVIFMPVDAAPGTGMLGPAAPSRPVLVSGIMVFDEKRRRAFTNMPAAVLRLNTGQIAIVSNIETSSNVMGFQTTHASGMWAMTIQPGSMTATQSGYLFWGRQKLTAFRFQYVDPLTGKTNRAVVASPLGDPAPALLAS